MRKGFAGAAVPTTLTGSSMTAGAPAAGGTFTIDSAAGWTFTTMPFVVVIDRGLPSEEKILCSNIAGATITVQQRGYDGTAAAAHTTGTATVLHVLDSITVDEANQAAEYGNALYWMTSAP